jgi:hypothetical protein
MSDRRSWRRVNAPRLQVVDLSGSGTFVPKKSSAYHRVDDLLGLELRTRQLGHYGVPQSRPAR